MKLEVGEYYLSAAGEIIQIEIKNKKESMYPYQAISGSVYMQDGRYFEDEEDNQDLIAYIPKQLLNHLIVEINNYHTDSDFRKIVDNVYKVKK